MTTALIDGDILLYSVGFSVEKTKYDVIDTKKSGKVIRTFNSSKDMWDWVSAQSQRVLDRIDYNKRVEVEPISHCLQNFKQTLSYIMEKTGCDKYEIYLTGDGNFREEIATIAEYKGNRDPDHKPVHYSALKMYMIDMHNATVIEGQEADDWLGIMQCTSEPGSTIIVSKDKDLKMIPGKHLDLNKNELIEISEEQAIRFFYTQLLTGDPTDNIKGIPGVGPKTAEKILKDCKTEYDMYVECLREYNKHYPDPLGAIEETGRLLWIRRDFDQMWEPPSETS